MSSRGRKTAYRSTGGRQLASGLVLTGFGLAAAWWLPLEKPATALGRFSHWQLLALVVAAALFASFLFLVVVPGHRRRGIGLRLAAVWLGTLSAVSVVEAVCWLWPPGDPERNPWYVNAQPAEDGLPFRRPAGIRWTGRMPGDMTYGFDPTASLISLSTDENGFRNSPTPHRADVVFLGDSYTEGSGVEDAECFVRLVASELDLSAANLGRSAYSPGPELAVLKHYAVPLKPECVIWQVCESNDLEDGATWYYWNQNGRPPFFAEGEQNRRTRVEAWKSRSPTWQFYSALRSWPWEGRFRLGSGESVAVRFFRPLLAVYHCPRNHPGWRVTVDALSRGQEILQQEGTRLLVVLVPLKLRVLGPLVDLPQKTRSELFGQWNAPEGDTWSNYLAVFCQGRNLEFLDLTSAFSQAAADGELPFLPYDTHLSPEGHKIAAREIVEALARQR